MADVGGRGPALIALDWGTSSLRAYLLDGAGNVIGSSHGGPGILAAVATGFEPVFDQVTGTWLTSHGRLPVIASGMIGSRQGWVETPYSACPASIDELAAAVLRRTTTSGCTVHFVGGLRRCEGALPDMMRGEETQLIGALADSGAPGNFVLPGTHSKWARAASGRIVDFTTYMTGELFAVLRQHSILGRLMTGDTADESAFARGVEVAHDRQVFPGGVAGKLFSARALALAGELGGDSLASYLSGLLIGDEIVEAQLAGFVDSASPVVIVGSDALAGRYRRALDLAGVASTAAPSDAAARGLFLIARACGLLS